MKKNTMNPHSSPLPWPQLGSVFRGRWNANGKPPRIPPGRRFSPGVMPWLAHSYTIIFLGTQLPISYHVMSYLSNLTWKIPRSMGTSKLRQCLFVWHRGRCQAALEVSCSLDALDAPGGIRTRWLSSSSWGYSEMNGLCHGTSKSGYCEHGWEKSG